MSLRRLSRARAFPLLLAALLACATYAPVRAVANSEIPGTPLPASGQITSAVGGSLFDLVYAVDVPAASVLARIKRTETLCTPPGFADDASGSAVRMEVLPSP